MATVGYGDVVPRTFFGKLTGACCAIMGILSMSFPGFYSALKLKNKSYGFCRIFVNLILYPWTTELNPFLVPVFVSHFNYLYNLEKCECKLRPEELLYNNNETWVFYLFLFFNEHYNSFIKLVTVISLLFRGNYFCVPFFNQ